MIDVNALRKRVSILCVPLLSATIVVLMSEFNVTVTLEPTQYNSLVAVFSQTLLPLLQPDGTKSGRVMAQEVMLVIPAIANLIREAKAAQIYSTMQTNTGFGMQTLEMALRDLYLKKRITLEDALARSSRPEEFKRSLSNS